MSLISAVMVTGKDPRRKPLMLAAIRSFQLQTYPNKELLIVYDCDDAPLALSELEESPHNIRLLKVFGQKTLGELRNIGLDEARGDYIAQWDDDDWSAEWRLQLQMNTTRLNGGAAVTLSHQVRYSFADGSAFVWGNPRAGDGRRLGIPGTILHPRSELRYLAEPRHEDSHFIDSWPKVAVCNNTDRPHTYLRFYHGRSNTWSERHIMQGRKGLNLSGVSACYLSNILRQHYPELKAA